MGRKIFPPEQIVRKLREAEVLISQGNSIGQASRQLGITEQTYYRAGASNMAACRYRRQNG